MNFPMLNEIPRYDDEKKAFRGYNHTMRCSEDEFFDMQNCTNQYYPAIAPRKRRGLVRNMTNPKCMCSLNKLYWVENGKLYADGVQVQGTTQYPLTNLVTETMVAMGAYLCLFPDGLIVNTDNSAGALADKVKKIRAFNDGNDWGACKFEISRKDGADMEYHDESYYEENDPEDGDMLLTMVNGKSVLKVYSKTTATWKESVTAYMRITQTGIGKNFVVGDGVYIDIGFISEEVAETFEYAKNLFPNEGYDATLDTITYNSNFVIMSKTDDTIVVAGLLDANHEYNSGLVRIDVERKIPEISYVIECSNRLWACDKKGHEIYCCKLGDPTNWYAYEGLSTDSYAVTIGSEGEFTGAITYMGYPMFFKENSFVKVAVSATGAHQIKETACRGVQKGSSKSLCMVNENLFYKAENAFMTYSGSLPQNMSDVFGEVRYHDAVGGTIDGRYYVSMKDKDEQSRLFVYDINVGCWTAEDDTKVSCFCRHENELYFISGSKMYSVDGSLPYSVTEASEESSVDWMLESANIDYRFSDSKYIRNFSDTNKYIGRLNVRLILTHGSTFDFYIQYDDGEWEHKFGVVGYGTKTVAVPVIPNRCDHFRYRIIGHGDCKILNITKAVEGGSDIYG